jgi:ribosomal protein S27AE
MHPVATKHRLEPVSRRACPRCHALVDWQASDPAFSATAEYRICPECDEAVFIGWRSANLSKDGDAHAPEAR